MSWRPPDQDAFVELGDDARLGEEVAARTERSQRLTRASELASWAGTLEDLAERRVEVVVVLEGGRAYRGALVAVGLDHVALRTPGGQLALLRTSTLRAVRPEPSTPAPVATGDRERSHGRRLADVLDRLAEGRERVVLGLRGVDDRLAGQLLGMGADVVTLRVEAGTAGVVYLPLDAVGEVVLDRFGEVAEDGR